MARELSEYRGGPIQIWDQGSCLYVKIARLWIPLAPEQNLVGSFFRGLDLAGSWARETVEDMSDTLSYKNPLEWIEKHPQPEADDEAGPVTAVTEARNPEPAAWLTGLSGQLRKGFSAVTISFGFIWLAVVGFLLIYKMSVYRRFFKTLRAGWSEPDDMTVLEHFGKMVELSKIRCVVRLYTNPQIASPLLIGFFHPCIVLPDINMPEADFTYTILHELTHLKRGPMLSQRMGTLMVPVQASGRAGTQTGRLPILTVRMDIMKRLILLNLGGISANRPASPILAGWT